MSNEMVSSIYNATNIYKTGGSGGGGGGGTTLAPFTGSSTKVTSPIGEIDNGVFTARSSNVGLTYGKEIDYSNADKIVLEITWKIQVLQHWTNYSDGVYLHRASDTDGPLFRIYYESGGKGYIDYEVYDSDNQTKAYVRVSTNQGTLYSNKTNILIEFIKSQKQLKVYQDGILQGTSNLTGPVNYTGVWRPIIGGARPGNNWDNLLMPGDEIYLNETHFYLDNVKQW